MHIIGGTYLELCKDPFWDELFGSGLRAVLAMSGRTQNMEFSTYCGKDELSVLNNICDQAKIKLNAHEIDQTIQFTYDHPLAYPTIFPLNHLTAQENLIKVSCDDVMAFGMLEGNAIIDAKRVVYDPQSPDSPISFWANGSKASELIVVLNFSEAKNISKSNNLEGIKDYLFNEEKVSAAIVKCGADGAYILQKSLENIRIPAFETDKVWPIGSGDIFSGMFGYYFLLENLSIEDAALQASKATAFFTSTQTLPIPTLLKRSFNEFKREDNSIKKVYLAGPFFTMAQRWLVNQFRDALRSAGLEVFSPLHDVGLGIATVVAPKDIEAIKDCNIVVAIVDGLDSGTLFEIGYARAKEIPVIAFVENETKDSLTMLEGTGCIIVNDFSTLIYRANWEANKIRG